MYTTTETGYKKLQGTNKQYLQFGLEWYQDTETLTYVIHNGFVFKVTPNGIFNNNIKFTEYFKGNKLIISEEIRYMVKNKRTFLIK